MDRPIEIRDRSDYKRRMNQLLRIDPCRTVVLTVDMQNEYLDLQRGAAPVAPEDALRVIGQSRRLLEFARAQGVPVVHAYVKRRPVEIEHGLGLAPYVEAS